MAVENRYDAPELAAARATQADPLVMYLVVREQATLSYGELLAAAAKAAIACVDRFAGDDNWAGPMTTWFEESFRKVTLRADEQEWQTLCELDHTAAVVDGKEVLLVLPPRRKSEREPLLKRLRTYDVDPATLPEKKVKPKPGFPNLLLVLNGAVTMSAGKAAAQAAHAALAALRNGRSSAHAVELWRRKGGHVEIASAGTAQWAILRAEDVVSVIRDAGLTEVVSGTETVLAVPPMLRPLEPELVRSLARP